MPLPFKLFPPFPPFPLPELDLVDFACLDPFPLLDFIPFAFFDFAFLDFLSEEENIVGVTDGAFENVGGDVGDALGS